MPVDDNGVWYPDLFPKQQETLQACLPGPQNMLLVNGPRWSGKTFALYHAMCQHAWNTDRGNICMLTITQSAGIDSGPWQHLTEVIIPEWIEGNFGMEWVREPCVQSVTKKPMCKVRNAYGNSTQISLESLKNEDEVEQRFKGKAYSCIWVNEMSKFKKRKTFDTLKQCLRMPHLTEHQHLFVCDTNPDLDLGQESPWYKIWYELRSAETDEELAALYPDVPPENLKPIRDKLKLVEFTIDDNYSLSDQKKAELMADFSHDPDLLAAYYYGRWVTASADAIFFKVFRPLVHVIGESPGPGDDEPEIMVPEPGCIELVTGWDPGASVNSAAVIAEKVFRTEVVKDEKGKEHERRLPIIKFLDELVVVDTPHDLGDFTLRFLERMLWWEKLLGREGKIVWRHWADRSVLDMRSPQAAKFFHQIIYEASDGQIHLLAAERGPGTVGQRVDLFKKMLFDDRLFFSRTMCPWLIQSVKSLKRGTSEVAVIAKGQRWKHAWDSASYLVSSECHEEMTKSVLLSMRKARPPSGGLVSVPI